MPLTVLKMRLSNDEKAAWDQMVANIQRKMGKSKLTYREAMQEILREKGLLPAKGLIY